MASLYAQINNLEDIKSIAGNEWTFEFRIVDETGTPVDLSSTQCSWIMCELGDPDNAILIKDGTISATESNVFTVKLESAETIGLDGRYLHQPIVVDLNGSVFRPAQGNIIFTPAIKEATIMTMNLFG